jgi:hypothetical protein
MRRDLRDTVGRREVDVLIVELSTLPQRRGLRLTSGGTVGRVVGCATHAGPRTQAIAGQYSPSRDSTVESEGERLSLRIADGHVRIFQDQRGCWFLGCRENRTQTENHDDT